MYINASNLRLKPVLSEIEGPLLHCPLKNFNGKLPGQLIRYLVENDHMTFTNNKFDKAIQEVVSKIKPGHVMSYGEVARAAGFPRHARMVSKAMGRSSMPLPWHRVVKSDRTLAFEVGSEAYDKQKRLLEKEGVQIINTKVVPQEPVLPPDLDELLWGPPDD